MKLNWKLGTFAGIVLALFSLYPQARLTFYLREHWNGNFAITDIDEMAYAAYAQSLIDGKARKNNPYTRSEEPQDESLFSIQFFVPYLIAGPARLLGSTAATAMTIAGVLAAFSLGISLFWLLGSLTGNSLFAMSGALIIVCFGALANGEGGVLYTLGFPPGLFFPALRRYVPAIPLPIFFAFCGFVWHMLEAPTTRRRFAYGTAAVLCFWLLVFSYFFIWTAAAMFLLCLTGMLLLLRPDGWFGDLKVVLLLGSTCSLALLPYGVLLSDRSSTLESVQALVLTHTPDFTRIPEYIGALVLLIIVFGIRGGRIAFNRAALFLSALAVLPIALHNQQILTGRELQPFHYSSFIANYVAVAALILVFWLVYSSTFKPALLVVVALISVFWGLFECHLATRFYDSINIERDKAFAIGQTLRKSTSSGQTGTGTVVAFDYWVANDLGTSAQHPILWAWHQMGFGGVAWHESKERYYQYLYFQGCDPTTLANRLHKNELFTVVALFGFDRYLADLTSNFKPLTHQEIADEADRYAKYILDFKPADFPSTVLSYAIVPNENKKSVDLSNIDKWYNRDAGHVVEGFTIYELKPKHQQGAFSIVEPRTSDR